MPPTKVKLQHTKLTEQEIEGRIQIGKTFCKKFVKSDRMFSAKFRDPSPEQWIISEDPDDDDGGDVQQDAAVGESNQLATNVLTKLASIAIGHPDWYVKCTNAQNAEIARQWLRAKWRLNGWVRATWKVLLKRYVSGMGCLFYGWNKEKRSYIEHVQTWDLAVDPHVQDWSDLRWAARRIRMPLREAIDRYGAAAFDSDDESVNLDKKGVEIWLYWDKQVEVHLYDGDVLLETPNLYAAVPLCFLEGDIDPGPSVWPIGDFALATGLQQELSALNTIISNSAKHGGPLNLVVTDAIGKGGLEAIENGQQQGYVPVKDLVTPPVSRIPGEPLSATLLEAKREAGQQMDSVTGVSQYARGVLQNAAHFATEVAAVTQQSGARGVQARIEFERWLTHIAEILLQMEVKFGGPEEDAPNQDEMMILYEALQDVVSSGEIQVIEQSTVFKDPSYEVQTAMQLLNSVAALVPLMAQTGQPVPDLRHYVDDLLRATGRQDTDRYWSAPVQQQPGPGGQPAPGGQQPAQLGQPAPSGYPPAPPG